MPQFFFNKIAALRPANLLKKRLWHRCFPVNFLQFITALFFIEHHNLHWSKKQTIEKKNIRIASTYFSLNSKFSFLYNDVLTALPPCQLDLDIQLFLVVYVETFLVLVSIKTNCHPALFALKVIRTGAWSSSEDNVWFW